MLRVMPDGTDSFRRVPHRGETRGVISKRGGAEKGRRGGGRTEEEGGGACYTVGKERARGPGSR